MRDKFRNRIIVYLVQGAAQGRSLKGARAVYARNVDKHCVRAKHAHVDPVA